MANLIEIRRRILLNNNLDIDTPSSPDAPLASVPSTLEMQSSDSSDEEESI